MSERAFDELIKYLYDAVMSPGGFQGFTEMLTETFRLKASMLIMRNVETQEIKGLWLCGITREWVESYSLEYAQEDMLAQHILGSPIAHFYASNLDVLESDRFAKTRFYNEWVVPQGVAYAAGAVVLQEGTWLTQLIVQRAPSQPPFAREEMEKLNRLIPHLQRAVQMRERFAELQLGQNFLAGGLDMLAMPTFLFNEHGRVAHYNRSAASLLQEGGNIKLVDGHLQASHKATTRKLSFEISQAILASRGGGKPNSIVLLPRHDRQPLMMMIAPLLLSGPSAASAALLFTFDPEVKPKVTADLVRHLFALSETEAELSVALCGGKTLDDFSIERGTSINTVKSQLKNIFVKTGTRRQSELVSLLLASPAYFLVQNHQ